MRFKNLKPNLLKATTFKPVVLDKAGKRKKTKKRTGVRVPERVIQAKVEEYLLVLGVKAIRLPDSLFRSIYAGKGVSLGVKSQISGAIAGLPDLMIPKITKKGTLILPLELKAKDGIIGPKQRKWEKVLGTVYAYSFDEAKKLIDDFLEGE